MRLTTVKSDMSVIYTTFRAKMKKKCRKPFHLNRIIVETRNKLQIEIWYFVFKRWKEVP